MKIDFKIQNIELANISRFRGELMGAAMLFIILFHVGLPREDYFYGLRRLGNIGVDIFLFLSGIGLWFSWVKRSSTGDAFGKRYASFMKKRMWRIYPAWLIMASLFYIPDYFCPELVLHRGNSTSIIDLIGDITINWDFWLHDELNFWYIPATMMLYLFAPLYMELIHKHPVYRWLPVAMITWCILVAYVTPINHAVGHLEIFWSRVPIFFIGINMGEAVRQKRSIDGQGIWLVILLFMMSFLASMFLEQVKHGEFPLFLERMLYIPLTVTSVLLLNRILRRTPKWVNSTLSWLGAMSLEAYLIHLHFVLDYIERLHMTYWPTFLATIAITIPLAWILKKIVDRISRIAER